MDMMTGNLLLHLHSGPDGAADVRFDEEGEGVQSDDDEDDDDGE